MAIFFANRWTAEDGRSWDYDGPNCGGIANTPQEVIAAAEDIKITDNMIGDAFKVNSDGTVTIWAAST